MLVANLNELVPLQIQAADGRTDLYGQVRVYTTTGTPVDVLSAVHVADGIYSVNWLPVVEGYYNYVTQLYFDSGHTIDAGYEHGGDLIEVSTFKHSIVRLLGLHHENTVIDQQVYDGDGNLTAARVRCYDSKANALAASSLGIVAIYSVAAIYVAGQLTKYTMVREQ